MSRVALVGVVLVAGCAVPPASLPEAEPLPCPAPAGSAEPALAADDDTLWLSWIEAPGDGPAALRLASARLPRGRPVWADPVTVAASEALFVNWADFPSVVLAGPGRLAAHWRVRTGDAPYAYGIRMALSDDAGATWSEAVRPHRDRSPTEHGFASLVPAPGGGVDVVWLDGRATLGPDPSAGATALIARTFADGAFGDETVVDPRVCDCCATAAVRAAGTLVVAYRDRGDDEVRDVSVVRRTEAGWTAPRPLHVDGWRIRACPVNGPALAARDATVVAAWFTAAAGRPRVLLARSTDAGATFGPPVTVSDGRPLGRVDVAVTAEGRTFVVWLEDGDPSAEVRVRGFSPAGSPDPPTVVAATSAARSAGFPRIVSWGRDVLVAWTGTAPGPQVRLARVRPRPAPVD